MSEMSGPSAHSGGSADAPTATDQSSAGDDLTVSAPVQPPEVASASTEDGLPPEAGASKLPEAGKANTPAGDDQPSAAGGQAAGPPKPAPPGKASAAADTHATHEAVGQT